MKRAPYALQEPVLLSDGKYQLPPRGLEGPWEEVTEEKACAKAIQVMRDVKVQVSTSDEIIFQEAEQEATYASVNASMKDSSNADIEQTAAMEGASAFIEDSMNVHHEIPKAEAPAMAQTDIDVSSDHLQLDEEGIENDGKGILAM